MTDIHDRSAVDPSKPPRYHLIVAGLYREEYDADTWGEVGAVINECLIDQFGLAEGEMAGVAQEVMTLLEPDSKPGPWKASVSSGGQLVSVTVSEREL